MRKSFDERLHLLFEIFMVRTFFKTVFRPRWWFWSLWGTPIKPFVSLRYQSRSLHAWHGLWGYSKEANCTIERTESKMYWLGRTRVNKRCSQYGRKGELSAVNIRTLLASNFTVAWGQTFACVEHRNDPFFIRWLLGVRIGLFTPDKAFDVVVKQRIEQLKGPTLKLIDLVVEEIKRVITDSFKKVQ